MSWRVANTCAEPKFGSAKRKQIIMFLADKASDDWFGNWCGQANCPRVPKDVDDEGHIHELLACRDIGKIADPGHIRRGCL